MSPEREPYAIVDGHPVEETWKALIVRVAHYGGDFFSIQTAINYCVTQAPTAVNRWTVEVYPGTYNEQITLAQYVDVVGVDKESVIMPVVGNTAVTMADDTRIANLTINPLATAVAGSAYGIEVGDADGCRIEDINMYLNRTGGVESVGIIENTNNTAAIIYIRNVRIRTDLVTNTNTHAISIRQANKTVYLEESYVQGSDYGLSIGVSGGAAIASTIWSKQNFFAATSATSRAVFCNGGEIWLHEDSINRGCRFLRENDGLIIYTDGNENYHVFEGMDIQDTLDNIPAAGCTVRVHDGTYAIVDSITITQSNVVLEGDGRATFIDGDGLATTEHGIVISGKTDVTIRNLSIQTEDGGGKTCHCIFIEDGADRCTIDGITIVNSDDRGINIEGTNIADLKIHNVIVENVDREAIYVQMDGGNYLDRADVSHNTILEAGSYGIWLSSGGAGSRYCTINSNIVRGTAAGNAIDLNEGYYCNVSDNIVDGFAYGVNITDCYNCNIVGNVIEGSMAGVYVTRSSSCVIDGNVCMTMDDMGIYVSAGGYDNVVSNNHIEACQGGNIFIGALRTNIEGNFCKESYSHGIDVRAANCLISSNYVYDSAAGGEHGIYLSGAADRCVVTGNYCSSPGDSQEDGIHLADGACNVQIIGNYCYNGMGSGIVLMANNDYCLIKDNYCSENDDYGVEIVAATCNHNVVENNELVGNITGQILDSGTDTVLPEIVVQVPNPSTNIGAHPAEQLTDGLAVTSRFGFQVPAAFVELVRAYVVIVPGGTGNLRRSVATDYGKVCTEVYNTHSEALADDTSVAVTINILECIDVSGALTGILANDKVGLAFTRHGENALDTVNANCWLLEFRAQYV